MLQDDSLTGLNTGAYECTYFDTNMCIQTHTHLCNRFRLTSVKAGTPCMFPKKSP